LSGKSLQNIVLNKFSQVKHTLNLTFPMPLVATLLNIVDLPRNRQKDQLIPPLKLRRIIGQTDDYTINRLAQLKTYCDLKPTDSILDVGCGAGSLAYSLIRYYNFQGKYEGFDIIKDFTEWLTKHYSKYFNFNFRHANVYSAAYNSTAKIPASKYKFPYSDNSFDIALVGSVFSHMQPAGLENYLSEVARVLKPNGKCLISYFLLTPLRPQELRDNEIRSRFVASGKGYSTTNIQYPEDAVAYRQEYILTLYEKLGLVLEQPIVYGELQDLIVAKKNTRFNC
jgi:SAM-dependent methyltransferase